MRKTELVIFDCDGVLVDSETVSNQVLVANLANYGLSLNLEEAMSLFVGGSMQGVMQEATRLGAALPDNWIDEIYAQTYLRLAEGVDPIDGIPALLAQLSKMDMPFCVASNGSQEKMRITLGQNGLLPLFENAMFSAHELQTWKPDPDLFLIAAKHFNVKPAHCVVIEDSKNGALAAKRAGMSCLAYAPHGEDPALLAHGAHCFSQMGLVAGLIGL